MKTKTIKIVKPLRLLLTLTAVFVAGSLAYKFIDMAITTFIRRGPQAIGGEIFIIPFMLILFFLGWEMRGYFQVFKEED